MTYRWLRKRRKSDRLYANKVYRTGIKNLQKEIKVYEGLKKYCELLENRQTGAVIRIKTFHIIMASQILLQSMPLLIEECKKNISKLKRKIK